MVAPVKFVKHSDKNYSLNLEMKYCNDVNYSSNSITHVGSMQSTFAFIKPINLKTMKMKKTLIIMMLAIAGCFGIASAQTPAVMISDAAGWHKIGEKTVDFKTESDEISVIGSDRFSTIKFKVTEAAINLVSLEVSYESGDKQDVAINQEIKTPGESRTIDLKGGAERSINKIAFVYKTLPNAKDEKAHVEIWGLKTNSEKK